MALGAGPRPIPPTRNEVILKPFVFKFLSPKPHMWYVLGKGSEPGRSLSPSQGAPRSRSPPSPRHRKHSAGGGGPRGVLPVPPVPLVGSFRAQPSRSLLGPLCCPEAEDSVSRPRQPPLPKGRMQEARSLTPELSRGAGSCAPPWDTARSSRTCDPPWGRRAGPSPTVEWDPCGWRAP